MKNDLNIKTDDVYIKESVGSYLKDLKNILEALAGDYNAQIKYLLAFFKGRTVNQLVVDELALEFDDLFRLVPQKIRSGVVSKQLVEKLKELDKKLERMSGEKNERLWTIDALKNNKEWVVVRKLAVDCLEELQKN